MRRATRALATGVMAASVVVGGTIGTTATAWADDEPPPTSIELLDKCNNGTDSCVFHPNGEPELYVGKAHQIGETLYNCGPGDATKEVLWVDSTSESNSVSISFVEQSEGDVAGFIGAFKSEFDITYGHKWGTTESTRRTTDVTVGAGQKGWLVRSTPMQRISGTYELHFGSQFHGHYIWYLPFTIEGAAPDAGTIDVVSQESAPMTTDEMKQCQ